ncbi:OadG family protein [Serpentinicella alkaliphila]|uniref:Sodium pump decarboxylase gamma subunit n=1 Tax=Serpentinicella alkaliphila TaxID=1734049 RepID=A0A4R2TEP3_9FIRM|nr:OadG family protein [Serpentinicella alkaliphila]QUH25366.1 OadG family protein [Serpentinicella alkaliphila]TCQ01541.1 sodium pump decarboxylase gamma subunit [Serpentinicella alkaliphila]
MDLIGKLKNSIDSLTLGEKILGGIGVSLFGMVVVFFILVLIMFAVNLLQKFAGESKKVPSESVSFDETGMNSEVQQEILEDYGELVAVITAAIAASLNTSTHNIVVKNITRKQDTTPAWSKFNRMQQLR